MTTKPNYKLSESKTLTRFLVGLVSVITLFSAAPIALAENENSNVPSIDTNPYSTKNKKSFLREGANGDALRLRDKAMLPDIIYPYLPAGGWIDNLAAPDAGNAPNIGAVEKIIIYLIRSFTRSGSAATAGSALWNLAITFSVFGLLLSGFLTFQGVAQGKKGPGEAIVSYVMKLTICVMMMTAIVPNIPPMLIGLVNYATTSVSDWFGYSKAGTGNMKEKEQKTALWNIYNTKLTAGHAAASVIWIKYMQASVGATGDDAHLKSVMRTFLQNMNNDPEVQKSLAYLNSTSGAFAGKTDYFAATWPELDEMIENQESTQDINAKIGSLAQAPMNTIINRQKLHLEAAFKSHNANNRPGSQALRNTIASAPQGVDISGFTPPSRVLQTYAYIAFAFLSISIWGMGFAGLIWTIIYSLPEEWNCGGILVQGFKGGLAIVLSAILISIYLSAGLVFTENKNENLQASLWDKTRGITDTAMDLASGGVQTAAKTADFLLQGGDFTANLAGWFSNNLLEHFMLGVLILSAPAQAALMIKGANGIGEQGAKALTAGGAGGQGMMQKTFGIQQQSSGASAATAGSASLGGSSGPHMPRREMAPGPRS